MEICRAISEIQGQFSENRLTILENRDQLTEICRAISEIRGRFTRNRTAILGNRTRFSEIRDPAPPGLQSTILRNRPPHPSFSVA